MSTLAPPQPDALDPSPEPESQGLRDGGRRRGVVSDHLFRYLALLGGLMVLIVLGLVAYSTTSEALPWFRKEGLGAVFSDNWNPGQNHFGALALLYGTFLVGFIALLIAVPISVGIALFVTEIAPYRVGRAIVYTVDLLAAIPSVVYGLWAVFVLIEPLAEIFADVSSTFDGVPILGAITASPSATGRSFLTAGIVVAIMITPIVTSLTREVFATTPTALKEAAYGLGSTKWEMIRGSVLPHSRGGVIAAVMIGLGRAIGETIAIALVIGSSNRITAEILGPGDTMASAIVNEFGEASGTHRSALIGLGVVLFALTILVGMAARGISARYDRRAGTVQ